MVEDIAQVLALGLERTEDLVDAINDLLRGHSKLPSIAAGLAAGALAGALAERITRRIARRPIRLPSVHPSAPGAEAMRRGLPQPGLRQLRNATQLLPVGFALLKNPLVRDALIGVAMRAGSRRMFRHGAR